MLTPRQHEALVFLAAYTKRTGYSPSFGEIAEALELASKSNVHRLIKALEERGYIRRLPNRSRAIEILKKPQGQKEQS
ncbi:LexA family protein [Thalassobacter stenotrophicus]|uniref:LexA repressor n=2 Tax=Thalassobacter stenotrophicus TaxID=266809 RepID=A0A0P1EYT6_9RHOB|nr:MarR family transcriptional regulator [Thalassobacter stenotrophicus]CUH60272.1 LexA repressor [Thalassobacter stenotrophicus]SHI71638.1 LexA DNA binding domain-containing protein [Thalassobacter stenotrophicus DSM 16310]